MRTTHDTAERIRLRITPADGYEPFEATLEVLEETESGLLLECSGREWDGDTLRMLECGALSDARADPVSGYVGVATVLECYPSGSCTTETQALCGNGPWPNTETEQPTKP